MAPRNPAPRASQPKGQASPLLAPLRYRKRSLWILAFYMPILVIPWAITCVMMVRPLNSRSYYQNRFDLSRSDLSDLLAGLHVIGVFEKIQAVLAIPSSPACWLRLLSSTRSAGGRARSSLLSAPLLGRPPLGRCRVLLQEHVRYRLPPHHGQWPVHSSDRRDARYPGLPRAI